MHRQHKLTSTHGIRILLVCSLLCSCLYLPTESDDDYSGDDYPGQWELVVDASFIDMRTGPGRGYPRFYSIARGESLRPVKQRTRWIKVETTKKRRGWILATDLENTRTLDGRHVRLP